MLLELAAPLRNGDAAFHQHCTQLVHQCGPFADQPVADAVEGLQVELLGTLQFDEAYRRPRRRFGNRFCIPVIVLLRLHTANVAANTCASCWCTALA